MNFSNHKNLRLGRFGNLSKYQDIINHFITTRHGGVSSNSYSSLNLGMMQDDPLKNVIENRSRVAEAAGLDPSRFVYPIQVHGVNIPRVHEIDASKGCFSLNDAYANTDGFVTNTPRLCLITLAADCVPIVCFDPKNNAIGVAHAGWKGTVQRISSCLVARMNEEFGSKPIDLVVGIGPSGGPCCYEVGNDVIDEVAKSFDVKQVIKKVDGFQVFDMWEANRMALIESGVSDENIEIAGICTISQNDDFFSARRGDSGRFAIGIFLK